MDKYITYCDGGCSNNGGVGAKAFGSYTIYKIKTAAPEDLCRLVRKDEWEGQLADMHAHLKDMPEWAEKIAHVKIATIPVPQSARATNNFAEMTTLFTLLCDLSDRNILRRGNMVYHFMDSELVIQQLRGVYRVKNDALRAVHARITDLVKKVVDGQGEPKISLREMFSISWIPGSVMKQTIIGH